MGHGRLLIHHPNLQQLLVRPARSRNDNKMIRSYSRDGTDCPLEGIQDILWRDPTVSPKKSRKAEKALVGWPASRPSAGIRVGKYHDEHRTQLNTWRKCADLVSLPIVHQHCASQHPLLRCPLQHRLDRPFRPPGQSV